VCEEKPVVESPSSTMYWKVAASMSFDLNHIQAQRATRVRPVRLTSPPAAVSSV